VCCSFPPELRTCTFPALAGATGYIYVNERVHRTVYPTRQHAMTDIARYIELRYNTQLLHSGLDYKTPHEVYTEYLNRQQAA
jgi:putative transposase